LLRPIAPHPLLELSQMLRLRRELAQRHLMRAPRVLHWLAIDLLRAGPSFWCPQHDQWPDRPTSRSPRPRVMLNGVYLVHDLVERGRHELMQRRRLAPLDEIRRVAISGEQLRQLVVVHPAEYRRISNLVTVEMQNGKHGAVPRRGEKLVRVPAGGQRARFCFAVSDHAGDEEIRVV